MRPPPLPDAARAATISIAIVLLGAGCDRRPAAGAPSPKTAAAVLPLPAEPPDPAAIDDLYAHCLQVVARLRAVFPNEVAPIFLEGQVHESFGIEDRALDLYEEGLRREPSRPDIHRRIGFMLSQRDRMDEAAGAYLAALALDPKLAGVHTRLGLIRAHQGRAEEAVRHYRAEEAAGTATAETWYGLGQALNLSKDGAGALAAFERCLDLEPKHTNALYGVFQSQQLLGNADAARAALAEFQAARKESGSGEAQLDADRSNRADQLRTAAETYRDAASTYRAGKRNADALWCLEASTRFSPQTADGFYVLADLLRQDGRAADAIAQAEKAVAVDPHHPRALHLLAGLYLESSRFAESAALLERLIALSPEDADPLCELALVHLRGRPRGAESRALALECARKAVDLERSPRNLDTLAWALFANGDRDAAEAALREALTLDPGNPDILRRLQSLGR